MKSYIERLQNWYKNNCDGDWEHGFGIKINTLDNPGWNVEIELADTCLEKGQYNFQYEKDDDDWIHIRVDDQKFIGFGDPDKLNEIFRIFLDDFFPSQNNPEFLYEIFIPVNKTSVPVWKAVKAKLKTESLFEIVDTGSDDWKETQVLKIEDFESITSETNLNDIDFKVGDHVVCELKEFFEHKKLVVTNKVILQG